MLRPANQNTRYCYEKALEAGQRAAAAREPGDREFWLERERHWFHLATSYDYQQRLSAFIAELRGLAQTAILFCREVPMRAKWHRCRSDSLMEFDYECPACEATQTLVEIEAAPRPS